MEALIAAVEAPALESLTWVDGVVVGVLLLSAAVGFGTGLIWQMFRIASVVAAYLVAAHVHVLIANVVGEKMNNPTPRLVCYGVLFLLTLLILYLVLWPLRKTINAMEPNKLERILGAVVGAAKGLVLCGVVAVGVLTYADEGAALRRAVSNSYSATLTAEFVRTLWLNRPED